MGLPESGGADQFCGKGGGTTKRWMAAITFVENRLKTINTGAKELAEGSEKFLGEVDQPHVTDA